MKMKRKMTGTMSDYTDGILFHLRARGLYCNYALRTRCLRIGVGALGLSHGRIGASHRHRTAFAGTSSSQDSVLVAIYSDQ